MEGNMTRAVESLYLKQIWEKTRCYKRWFNVFKEKDINSFSCSSNEPLYTNVPISTSGLEPEAATFGENVPNCHDYLKILNPRIVFAIPLDLPFPT